MTQTYRTTDLTKWGVGKGSRLTSIEGDNNIWALVLRLVALESLPGPGAGIASFEVSGSTFFVHLTDATTLGPYDLPMILRRARGVWAPATSYSVGDTFTINGGLYSVLVAHTSAGSFDAGATDGLGDDLYFLEIQTPGNALPTGGAVGQVVGKSDTPDFAVTWVWKTPTGGSAGQYQRKMSATQDDTAFATIQASEVHFTPPTGSALTATNAADAIEQAATLGAGGGGAISDLTDVSFATGDPQDGALLVFNSLDWVPTPTPSIGDIMQWQGGDGWQLVPLAFNNLSGDLSVSQLRSAVTNTNLGSTASGPVSIDPSTDTCFNIALSGDVTLNASSMPFGEFTLLVYQLTTTSRTLTFGTDFKTSGSLSTGTASGKAFVLKFFCDGGSIYELSRTAAL